MNIFPFALPRNSRSIPAAAAICLPFFIRTLCIAGTAFLFLGQSRAADVLPKEVCGMYGWTNWRPKQVTRQSDPYLKGVALIINWKDLEPEPGKFEFEKLIGNRLRQAAQNDFQVMLRMTVAPAGRGTPEWLFTKMNVPLVQVPERVSPFRKKVKLTFPYYLDKTYQKYFFRMIEQLGRYLCGLPDDLSQRLVFVQSAEGSTGDGDPYKGKPLDPKYKISRERWSEFRISVWKAYQRALTEGTEMKFPLVVNGDFNWNISRKWLLENLDVIGVKQGMFSHGYQIPEEQERLDEWRRFRAEAEALGKKVFSRGEMDDEWQICGWCTQNPDQGLYWSAIYATHCGLDIWNLTEEGTKGERFAPAMEFFNRYAGQHDPASSPAAFCALRKGLDASDKDAYPESVYGKCDKTNIDRYMKIAEAFSKYGAIQGDPKKAIGGGMLARQRDHYNDVGWKILRGNFERFLTQIDPDNTSTAWWHVKPESHRYSRWARSFDHAGGKRKMSFKLDPKFFSDSKNAHPLEIRIAYLDQGKGSWKLSCSTPEGMKKVALVQNGNTGEWKDAYFEVENFSNAARKEMADFTLEYAGGDDTLFHMVEILRR